MNAEKTLCIILSIILSALVNPDSELVSIILLPGDDMPVTVNFLPLLID